MSLRTLPILFFNLGGEMLYILDQRLKAQHVLPDKAAKVMRDIVGQMFDNRCVKELYKPQKVFTKKALKTVFERLAHASIMKLNSTAMEKLYDLMVMAVKYQFLLCLRGEDVVLVTLNHLDAIRDFVGNSRKHVAVINEACKSLIDFYKGLTTAQYLQLRYTLLSVFQDSHKRVSMFLKNRAQSSNGRFILPRGGKLPFGFEQPGAIRYFNEQGECIQKEQFATVQQYEPPQSPGSWEIEGDRITTLGSNMYAVEGSSERTQEPPTTTQVEEVEESAGDGDPLVKAELDLLEKLLIGFRQHPISGDTFKLKLFPDMEDEDEKPRAPIEGVLQINPTKKGNDQLLKIVNDFSTTQQDLSSTPAEDDLLDLLDSAL